MKKSAKTKAAAPKGKQGRPREIKPPLTDKQMDDAYFLIKKLRLIVEIYDFYSEQIKQHDPSSHRDLGLLHSLAAEHDKERISSLKGELDTFRAVLLSHCKTKQIDTVLEKYSVQTGPSPLIPTHLVNRDVIQPRYRDLTSHALAKWLHSEDNKDFERAITLASYLQLSDSILAPFSGKEFRLHNQKLAEEIKAISENDEVQNVLKPHIRNDGTYERSGYRAAADLIVKKLTGQYPPRSSETREKRETKRKKN